MRMLFLSSDREEWGPFASDCVLRAGAGRVLLGSRAGAAGEQNGCCQGAERVLLGSRMDAAREQSGCCWGAEGVLLGSRAGAACRQRAPRLGQITTRPIFTQPSCANNCLMIISTEGCGM